MPLGPVSALSIPDAFLKGGIKGKSRACSFDVVCAALSIVCLLCAYCENQLVAGGSGSQADRWQLPAGFKEIR
jgi:hypothetical protein